MFEHSKLLAKGVNEAIKILESDVLSAEVETSELYSLENIFSAYSWYCEECGELNESDLRSGCEIECEHCGSYCPDVDDDSYKLADLVHKVLVKRGEYLE